jgi:hypothetical protein
VSARWFGEPLEWPSPSAVLRAYVANRCSAESSSGCGSNTLASVLLVCRGRRESTTSQWALLGTTGSGCMAMIYCLHCWHLHMGARELHTGHGRLTKLL